MIVQLKIYLYPYTCYINVLSQFTLSCSTVRVEILRCINLFSNTIFCENMRKPMLKYEITNTYYSNLSSKLLGNFIEIEH